MFRKITAPITRWPKTLLITCFLVVAGLSFYGLGVFGSLTEEQGFVNREAESDEVRSYIQDHQTSAGSPTGLVLLESKDGTLKVQDQKFQDAARTVLQPLRDQDGAKVLTYYETGSPDLVSRDNTKMIALVSLEGTDDEKTDALLSFQETTKNDSLKASVGGALIGNQQSTEQVQQDLEHAELLTLPILAVLLFFVFRSVIAALIPLLIGVVAILSAFGVTRALTNVTDIDQYALNVITILGLGLSVDYSLLMVSRFREELHRGKDKLVAVRTTIDTAGRTILFSGLTVMACLLALTVFPIGFLRSVGVGGVSVLLVTVIESLTILPALLFLLGGRIDMWHIGKKRPMQERGLGWRRLATVVTNHPVLTMLVGIAVIAVVSWPLKDITFIATDYRALPAGSSSRYVSDVRHSHFPSAGDPIVVLYTPQNDIKKAAGVAEVDALGKRLAETRNVTEVRTPVQMDDQLMYAVYFNGENDSANAQQLVGDIRGTGDIAGVIKVGGEAAIFYDTVHTITRLLPTALLIIIVSMFVLLGILLRSLLVPLQAIIINMLALAMAFSALVLVFQQGHLTGSPTGFIHMGGIDVTIPILIFTIAFGLSMDYASFLYSRTREEYDLTNDNKAAIINSIQHTGPIITAAALILFVVIVAFAFSKIALLQEIGLGLSLAVLIDAFFVRLFFVPAVLQLFGRANWYVPRLYDDKPGSPGLLSRLIHGPDTKKRD